MSLPIDLSLFSKGVRQAFPYLTAAANTDQTPTQILDAARAAGFAFRTQQALDVIGQLRNNITAARSIRVTPPDTVLDPSKYGTSVFDLPKNYSYTVLARLRDEDTGETVNQYVTVTSNSPLSQSDILSTAESYATRGNYVGNGTIDEMTVTDAIKSRHLGE